MDKLRGTISGVQPISGEMNAPRTVYENDYEKLKNHPTLDGREIVGDIEEKDPTVPDWAKENTKPVYGYEEIGAVGAENEMRFDEIDRMFNAVFGI